MADVRTYLKTSGKQGTATIAQVDAERVRVNWRDNAGKLITSQVMPAGEAQTLAGTITDFLTPVPEPPPAPTVPDSQFTTLVLDEQFNGPTLDLSRWSPYSTPGDHATDAGIRDPSAFSIVDNQLVITAKWDAARRKIVTGGMAHRKDYTYGRFEARVRCEHDVTGQMSAVVLTWPQSGVWPRDGENDFYETGRPNTRVKTFIHRPALHHDQVYCDHGVSAQEWHTLTMDWGPKHMRVYCDGKLNGEWTDPALFPHVPHHVCPQFDVFGKGIVLPAPVRMFVDYVKIWQ